MTGENGRENFYQKTVGSKASTPIEVVDMGLRGFTRKIGILKDYNANFQCGQCHNAANRYLTYKWLKDDKPVKPEDLQKAGVSPYATEFLRIPRILGMVQGEGMAPRRQRHDRCPLRQWIGSSAC